MRSDHRHELKTNELADWLTHFPDWLKANRTTLIASAAVIVVAVAVYFWMFYQKNIASAREQVRLTNLVTQLPRQKAELAQAAEQGDQSYLLLNLAKDLDAFAGGSGNRAMSALALIERGDTLRAELHYRRGEVTREEIAKQIALAQASYEQAFEKTATIQPSLAATARFGVGLCEEELGNLDKARETYQDVAESENYAGTAARAAAAFRLKTMDDYKGTVVFKPAPQPPARASMPTFQLTPGDANSPVMIPMPNDMPVGPVPVAPEAAPAPSGDAPAPSEPAAVEVPVDGPDANAPTGG